MGLVGKRDGRNFGYGRQLRYARAMALQDMFGGGHYGTVKAHADRWEAFVKWCPSEDGPGMMRGELIGNCWLIIRRTFVGRLSVVSLRSVPGKTVFPV
jgi:hypothetical protein